MRIGPGGTVDEDVNGGERHGRSRFAALGADRQHHGHAARHLPGRQRRTATTAKTTGTCWPTNSRRPSRRCIIGEREQYRQFQEKFDDQFMLGDLTMEFDLGGVLLTSISSYTERDILVTRDATQLTGSVTYFNLAGDGPTQVRVEFDAVRLHDGRDLHAGTAPQLGLRGPLPVGGRRLLQRHRPRLRPDPADARLRRHY